MKSIISGTLIFNKRNANHFILTAKIMNYLPQGEAHSGKLLTK